MKQCDLLYRPGEFPGVSRGIANKLSPGRGRLVTGGPKKGEGTSTLLFILFGLLEFVSLACMTFTEFTTRDTNVNQCSDTVRTL